MRLLFAFALSCMLMACHEVTEFEGGGTSGLSVIDLSTMEAAGTIGGLGTSGCMLSIDWQTMPLASTDGRLYLVDPGSVALDTSVAIGSSSASGYLDMTRLAWPWEDRLYIIGAAGLILDFSLINLQVRDQFYAGSNPIALCTSPDGQERVYTICDVDDMIRSIDVVTNEVVLTGSVQFNPTDLAAFVPDPPGVLVCCDDEEGTVFLFNPVNFYAEHFQSSAPCVAMASVPEDSSLCVLQGTSTSSVGTLKIYRGAPMPESLGSIELDGTPVDLCASENGAYYCSLHWNGSMSVVYVVDGQSASLVGSFTLDGYPGAICTFMGDYQEYLLVLTTE